MRPRFLLDTNVVIRWLYEPRRLSREQTRVLTAAEESGEPVAISAMTLLEVVTAVESGRVKGQIQDILDQLSASARFQIFPITTEIASEMTLIRQSLDDQTDRVIVATARVHRLKLLTSDQRIIDSRLVAVID